jgi:glycerophosphoryl diester phosphodiesterase
MTAQKLIVAHRGVRVAGHTNTLEAFDRAIRLGADMLEFDVRRTGDLEAVVHHDDEIGGRKLAEMDVAEAVRCSAAHGFRMPTLEEVLALTGGRVRLDVELKEGGYEADVLDLIFEARFRVADFVVTSFDEATLARVRDAAPGVRIGLLVDADGRTGVLERFEASGADFLAPHHSIVDDGLLRAAGESAVELLPWTVNESAKIVRLLRERSVSGVITDEPAAALRLRGASR